MPRGPRKAPGGLIYHVLNRAAGRRRIFNTESDYAAFEKVLAEAVARYGMRLLAWCIMPNHWHLVAWPREDGELSAFMRWLCTTHVRRWQQHRHRQGEGHLYQGRYKNFPVQAEGLSTGAHLLSVCRYVERNPLRAKTVRRAERYRWSSLRARAGLRPAAPVIPWPNDLPALEPEPWPVEAPAGAEWVSFVNEPQTDKELEALRASVRRGRPYGGEQWQNRTAAVLGLEFTFRRRGPVPKAMTPSEA